ncbi:uncharacterized protein [Aristolochia californica]|uniref:uncharacterized protein n=1 Tax=Aristolochia californica TaxID=171875 RepID=UPI0035DAC507
METPSSMRRVTRSQTKNICISKGKKDEAEMVLPRSSRKGTTDRSALVDITNGSPIVGLALENLDTPSSVDKNCARPKQTPGSGEALLRGQVKTLLQKIEEGTELMKQRPCPCFQGPTDSPALGLLAPTPANTPQAENLSNSEEFDIKEDSIITEVSNDNLKKEGALESTESSITRALLFESPGKSDVSGSSVFSSEITYEISSKSIDEDNPSVWSVQSNASSHEEEEEYSEVYKQEYEEEQEHYEGGEIDELCEGLSRICVEGKGIPPFVGRHTRFVYNSDDEIEGEEVAPSVSPSVLRLKGLPTPEGKHLRFNEEDVEDQ